MVVDVKLFQDSTGLYDIDFSNGDFDLTDGLDTAIILSIFGEKRASKTEIIEPLRRRGHFTNEFSQVENYEVGSKQWLFSEQVANSQSNLTLLENTIREGLQWMVQDDIISNSTVRASKSNAKVNIEIDLKGKNKDDSINYNTFINTFN